MDKKEDNFRSELDAVADTVGKTIRTDAFPSKVRPGYLRAAVRDYPLRAGKRLRPALLMWCAGLFGARPETAKFAAAAVEIFHNWTLVHDDIIDNDSFRRGRPSAHSLLAGTALRGGTAMEEAEAFGRSAAMLAGDIQHAWAVNMLLRSAEVGVKPATVVSLVGKMTEYGGRDLVGGEMLDVDLSFRPWHEIHETEIMGMILLKTGALLRLCAESGAIIGLDSGRGRLDEADVETIGEFAKFAGAAFQLKDDWLGVYGDSSRTGKPALSDLAMKKPTLLFVLTAGALSGRDKRRFMGLLGKGSYNSGDTEFVRRAVRECGAEGKTLAKARTLSEKARARLGKFPDGKYRRLLQSWADYLLIREK